MTYRERWLRTQELFHAAAQLPSGERSTFLQRTCSDDTALQRSVLRMLDADARGDSVLDRGLPELAREVFQRGEALVGIRRVGRYRIERKLGEGGMGVVYLAEREDLGGLVAIKVLRDSWVSAERRQRFASEQRFLAGLDHQSIARLYDADTLDDGTPYFVMEYVEGTSLVHYCEERKTSLVERLALFRAVCNAVQYAHDLALIHRDLKPENILVKADGSVRLLDFGIAKELQSVDAAERAEHTRGLPFMTPAYAAPEQLRGSAVGLYTDVYSLGVILYRLLAGRLPFVVGERTLGELREEVTRGAALKPSEAARQGETAVTASRSQWADLDVLVQRAMHPDPQQRYRTVEALGRDVDHFLRHEPLEARPDSLGYRWAKFARRNRLALRVTLVATAVLVALVAFFTVRLTRARDRALGEVARNERIQRFMKRLFQGDEAQVGPADDLRVVTLLERGVREARSLDRDPEVQADLLQTLGTIYGDLGRFERAEELLLKARDRRRALFGAESAESAESLVALGLLRQEQARFDESERLVRDAVNIASRALPPQHPVRARSQAALGHVLVERGSYRAALPVLQAAAQLLEARGDQPLELRFALSDWANAQFYLGNLDASESLNRKLLALDRRTLGDQHANVADDLINLACIDNERGNYAESERLNREALVITERWFGPDHPLTASNLTQLGRALDHEGKDAEAESLLRRALTINERVYPAVHPSISSTLNDLGLAARNLHHLDEAEADFRRMLEIERALHGDNHERVGVALSNLGSVACERGDFDSAEKLLREALGIYAKRGMVDHVRSGFARIYLGHVLTGQKRWQAALAESQGGYEIMLRHKALQSTAMPLARRDLQAELSALGRAEEAARYRDAP